MVDILSKYIIYNKPFSAWVLKSNIMPNKLYIFFEEIPKWGDVGAYGAKRWAINPAGHSPRSPVPDTQIMS